MFIPGGSAIESGGYNISNSLRFRRSASAYLNRTPASAGNRQVMTYSFWVKRGFVGSLTSDDYCPISAYTDASNLAVIYFNSSNSQSLDVFFKVAGTNYAVTTTQRFADPSAWYHIVIAIDTTQATASNRTKIYVNGSQVTAFSAASYVPQNSNLAVNNNVAQYFGTQYVSSSYFDGYLAEVNFIDGQALTPSSFGATDAVTGVWAPKAYTGTYGTNGFYLKFSDIATTSGSNAGLGKDFSGNGNYWTTNNISVTAGATYDAMTDSPTLTSSTVANYCVLNPLALGTDATLSNGNLTIAYGSGGSGQKSTPATMAASSGKWYYEFVCTTSSVSPVRPVIGVQASSMPTTEFPGYGDPNAWGMYLSDGNKFNNNTSGGVAYGSSFAVNDIAMCAFDLDNGKIWWGKNGTWFASGDPAAGTNAAFTNLTGTLFPAIGDGSGTQTFTGSMNFGQRPFSYTPPTGFNRLNTYNLPDSTIKKGNSYMDATLYTGNGGATQTITNAALFKPDFVWVKSRSAAYRHGLFDSVRGVGSGNTTDRLQSNATDAQDGGPYMSSLNSNGFTITNYNATYTENATTYVGWQWQAGQGTTTTNTAGSITSTVSVNATAGFSVVSWTANGVNGATIGHGLGVAPAMMIFKERSAAGNNWSVYHKSIGNTGRVFLDLTNATSTSVTAWNNTSPTSTVFTVGTSAALNTNGSTMVGYCWAEIAGFSKFGSYTGNGSADGAFVYLGFRPAFVMLKNSSTTDSWLIKDDQRAANYNPASGNLYPNLNIAEDTGSGANIDFLSNGFKVRGSNISVSGNGNTIIYAAFAENPFKNALAR